MATLNTLEMGKTGVFVARVGEGTWNMESEGEESVRTIRAGLDLGVTHIDTAEMYGSGRVESLVGKAIRGRRHEVYLVSKVLPSNASRSGVKKACERSLARLGTDYLDQYLLHWPSPVPIHETIAGFEDLVKEGKIRSYGVSNFDASALEEAVRAAGPGRIASNQVLYHLEERSIEAELVPTANRHSVSIVAYSPFAQGSLPRPGSK